MSTLNSTILEVINDTSLFPRDKGYRFTPVERDPDALHINPRDPIYDGVYRDIIHPSDNVVLARKAPCDEVTYCCGVSFEAWYYALQNYYKYRQSATEQETEIQNPLTVLTSTELLEMVNTWFCPVMGHDGVVSALNSSKLGEVVNSLEDAQPGDLIQYWRSVDLQKPSGHSAIFLNYDPETNLLRYWSSQRSTNGIAENQETVVENVWKVYIIRPFVTFRK